MKTRKLESVFMIALFAVFVSCSDSATSVEDVFTVAEETKSVELATAPADSCDFSAILSENEIKGLMEMREEEKLARDVYRFFDAKYNHRIFQNISKSENAHTSAVLYLINGFELSDPAPKEAGVFTAELFNTLYSDLTQKGSANLVAALKTGAFIEEYDIADLERLMNETDNETIKRVYGNLLRASKVHLRAFTNVLKINGETYTPTVISSEEYNKILNE